MDICTWEAGAGRRGVLVPVVLLEPGELIRAAAAVNRCEEGYRTFNSRIQESRRPDQLLNVNGLSRQADDGRGKEEDGITKTFEDNLDERKKEGGKDQRRRKKNVWEGGRKLEMVGRREWGEGDG